MKQTTGKQKGARPAAPLTEQETGACTRGIALAPPVSRVAMVDSQPLQRMAGARGNRTEAYPANRAGLPARLKAGIEQLSGMSMDDVKVHYNSTKPAQLQALAYTQGHDIHVAPGQERHLPHEAWHVVQQGQGRVQSNINTKGVIINKDLNLESEADEMGQRAITSSLPLQEKLSLVKTPSHSSITDTRAGIVQLVKVKRPSNIPLTGGNGVSVIKSLKNGDHVSVTYKLGDTRDGTIDITGFHYTYSKDKGHTHFYWNNPVGTTTHFKMGELGREGLPSLQGGKVYKHTSSGAKQFGCTIENPNPNLPIVARVPSPILTTTNQPIVHEEESNESGPVIVQNNLAVDDWEELA